MIIYFSIFYFAAADTILVDHKLLIERIVELDVSHKILSTIIELEQGIFGERVQDDRLSYIPNDSPMSLFGQISFLGQLSQLSSKTEAAIRFNSEEIVAVRRRFNAAIPCDVTYSFPFDSYECKLKIVSEKPKDEFDIRWATRYINTPTEVAQFRITSTTLNTCTFLRSVPSGESAISTNELHGCLQMIISLERPLVVAVFRYFAPTTIMLMLSWLAFYQRRDKSGIRLIVFCAFALIETIIVLNYLNSCPPSAKLTPADIWALVLCINAAVVVLMLFLISLAETRATKFRNLMSDPNLVRKESMARYQKQANKHLLHKNKDMEQSQCSTYSEVVNTVFKKRADSAALTSVRLQIAARILCPIVFLISVVLFFSLSVVASK